MSTTESTRDRFIETVGETSQETIQSQYDDVEDTEGLWLSADETIIRCPSGRDNFGRCVFDQYHTDNSWSMGYAEWDDSTKSVYIFNDPENRDAVVIDADKIEAVAKILETTPAHVANKVQTYRYYPILINSERGYFLISPLMNVDPQIED